MTVRPDEPDEPDRPNRSERPDRPERPGPPARARVAELVARLAEGDLAALVPFVVECRSGLTAVIRRTLEAFGRRDVLADRDRMEGLVHDAALVIMDRAAAWSPDGALPWWWAERAIRQAVVAELGHPSVPLDDDGRTVDLVLRTAPAVVVSVDHGTDLGLEALGERHPAARLLHEAIGTVGSDRDQRVHIEYQVQKALGDPSPAVTVAEQFNLLPANVRQIDRRMRLRLQRLADADERYASLADLAWCVA